MCLGGVWFGVVPRTNFQKDMCLLIEIELHAQNMNLSRLNYQHD